MGNETSLPQSEPQVEEDSVSQTSPRRAIGNLNANGSASSPKFNGNSHVYISPSARVRGHEGRGTPSSRSISEMESPSGSMGQMPISPTKESTSSNPENSNVTLRGIIVGKEQTGKTSLVRRLRGEDPFAQQHQQTQTSLQQNNRGQEKRNLIALVPWKLPQITQNDLTIEQEDLVQLFVSEGKSFQSFVSTTSKNDDDDKAVDKNNLGNFFRKEWVSALRQRSGKELDFVVWILNPKMENLLDFVRVGLEILFPAPININCGDDGCDEKSDKPKSEKLQQPTSLIQNLCILLNFRDLLQPANKQDEGESSVLEKVREISKQILDRHTCHNRHGENGNAAARSSANQMPTILVYESSMENCYGLLQLHSFITLPYLSRKEKDLLRRAENMHKSHAKWKEGLMEWNVVGYEAFAEKHNERISNQKQQQQQQELQKKSVAGQRRAIIGRESKKQLNDRDSEENNVRSSGMSPNKRESQSINEDHTSPHVERGSQTKENENKNGKQEKSSVTASTNAKNAIVSPLSNADDADDVEINSSSLPQESTGPRKLFLSMHDSKANSSAWTPLDNTDNNLDSFFSDDEDDEEEKVAVAGGTQHTASKFKHERHVLDSDDSSGSSSDDRSDDDEDDDFFIDNTGNRHAHAVKNHHIRREASDAEKEGPPVPENNGINDKDSDPPIPKEEQTKESEIVQTGDRCSTDSNDNIGGESPVSDSSGVVAKNKSEDNRGDTAVSSDISINENGGHNEEEKKEEMEVVEAGDVQTSTGGDDNVDGKSIVSDFSKAITKNDVTEQSGCNQNDTALSGDSNNQENRGNNEEQEFDNVAVSEDSGPDIDCVDLPAANDVSDDSSHVEESVDAASFQPSTEGGDVSHGDNDGLNKDDRPSTVATAEYSSSDVDGAEHSSANNDASNVEDSDKINMSSHIYDEEAARIPTELVGDKDVDEDVSNTEHTVKVQGVPTKYLDTSNDCDDDNSIDLSPDTGKSSSENSSMNQSIESNSFTASAETAVPEKAQGVEQEICSKASIAPEVETLSSNANEMDKTEKDSLVERNVDTKSSSAERTNPELPITEEVESTTSKNTTDLSELNPDESNDIIEPNPSAANSIEKGGQEETRKDHDAVKHNLSVTLPPNGLTSAKKDSITDDSSNEKSRITKGTINISKQKQTSLILDSDDESVNPQNESRNSSKCHNRTESVSSDEFVIGSSADVSESSKPNQSQSFKKPHQIPIKQPATILSTTVSNAALAAIEAAKREAEQIMAQSQASMHASIDGDVIKEKKSKSKDKKKSEKKKTKKSSVGEDGEKKKKKKKKEKKCEE